MRGRRGLAAFFPSGVRRFALADRAGRRFTTVLGTPHVYLQEESQTIWDDFFSKYSRGEDGTLYYEDKAVTADTYVSADDWYTPATAE